MTKKGCRLTDMSKHTKVVRGIKFDPVKLRGGEECSWRKHFRGLLRDVVSYLDLLANNDPERFVFARVEDIIKHTQKLKDTPYNRRQVEYALAYLRSQWIVSGIVTRLRFGVWHEGRIVTPHYAMCSLNEKGQCMRRSRTPEGLQTKWHFVKNERGGGCAAVWIHTARNGAGCGAG